MSEALRSSTCFISYAHIDRGMVARITADLQKQGITVWVDGEGITPGMPDWEATLRVAIQSSRAVILIASPHAPSSRYVRDELALAHYYRIPVYPLWIAGDQWIESIPLGWGSAQYIDARGVLYGQALVQLLNALNVSMMQSQTAQLPARHRILPPQPADDRYFQQREYTAREIYTLLTSSDVTAVTLTGIGGVGKSTLAALVFNYSEDLRLIARGLFLAEPIWLRIETTMTMSTLVEKVFEALGEPLPDLKTLLPRDQALMILEVLNTLKLPRLIIFDQFENLLDWQSGRPLADRPGVGELIDVLDSQSCASRILLTSRSVPHGTLPGPQSHLKIHFIEGMSDTEGIELLRKRGVLVQQATNDELLDTVHKVAGHALALTLIASILQKNRSVSTRDLFTSSLYTTLWVGNIAENLLGYIYKQLDSTQRKLLQAFSVE